MKFKDIYRESKRNVSETLRTLWCSEQVNDSQRAFGSQISEMIPEIFAPSDAVPLVQCMNMYKSVWTVTEDDAKSLVAPLWTKEYPPYEHQFQSWKALQSDTDGRPKSICVTTGTGSGKTECFMMPLIHDIARWKKENPDAPAQVRAIFLYPLNALMEDQKERLEEMIAASGVDIRYTVYNGDLVEKAFKENATADKDLENNKKIEALRGVELNKETGKIETRFPHMVASREEVRKNPPEIILTNPTMLEYILLRRTDNKLIIPGSLKWFSIDETHTYTGAGAAELSLLIRRVLLAFGVKPSEVRFATSSATFGNSDSIPDPEARRRAAEEEREKLRQFIADITGTELDQIEVIGGERVGEEKIPDNEDRERWTTIFHKEYVKLDELFPGVTGTECLLEALDEMVARQGNSRDMKVKVHYFFRVPNNGLYVHLDRSRGDGSLVVKSVNDETKNDANESPAVEIARCTNCGEYLAVVNRNNDTGEYEAPMTDDSDIFDIEETADASDRGYERRIVGVTNKPIKQGNVIYVAEGNKLKPTLPGQVNINEWHLVANTKSNCPHCNAKVIRGVASDDTSQEATPDEESKLRKFRVSADIVSRVMAPVLLDQLDEHEAKKGDPKPLHNGQQYISFADSRQLAARATLRQNMEQERMWVYLTIYHELSRRAFEKPLTKAECLAKITEASTKGDTDEVMRLSALLSTAPDTSEAAPAMTWEEVCKLLMDSPYCERYCYEFLKRSGVNAEDEWVDGHLTDDLKKKYVLSIMVQYFTSRPRADIAPETMGLFHMCYPKLEKIKRPKAVENGYNAIIQHKDNKIEDQDWRNLLNIFIDYVVRSNQSVYLELDNCNEDIHSAVRFATEKSRRRAARKPVVSRGQLTSSRILRYLVTLICRDNPGMQPVEALNRYFTEIDTTVNAMWKDLTEGPNALLAHSTHFEKDNNRFVKDDPDEEFGVPLRLNFKDMSFCLYNDVWLCDANSDSDKMGYHAERMRPIEVNFKGFAPYLVGGEAVTLKEELHETWEPFLHYAGTEHCGDREAIEVWAKEKRTILWREGGLWGEKGYFADRLNDIHAMPNLFIQAEHTAQVDKGISRKLQKDFQSHQINILACSTTMEMGVDLGTLQLVMLTSVPPMPSNYKQRSGRDPMMVKSACVTLCGSDAIGLRTLTNPLENIINRPVDMPFVDLGSEQVVQRHINSFLVRYFDLFGKGSVNQKVVDFYSKYSIEGKDVIDRKSSTGGQGDSENDIKSPNDKLGPKEGTCYQAFDNKCREQENPSDDLRKNLEILMKGVKFNHEVPDGDYAKYCIAQARKANKDRYNELDERLENIKIEYASVTGANSWAINYRKKLKRRYREVLDQALLKFWSTNRFSPNANMPVAVIQLDLSPEVKKQYGVNTESENPSYSLREALTQYAPGNNVVVDGVVFVVRGIQFRNQFQGERAFKRIAHNAEQTVIDDGISTLASPIGWWDDPTRTILEMVEPVGFIPDSGVERSRILENNRYTQVSAQLIGANPWTSSPAQDAKLYQVRCNRDMGGANILYYNEGIGYGYCLCIKCGRIALESEVIKADPSDPSTTNLRLKKLPDDFNTLTPKKYDSATGLKVKDKSKPKYHNTISGGMVTTKCTGSNDPDLIRRNIILGGTMQTDFSEIRIRHQGKAWMDAAHADRELLLTLGIVFASSLMQIIGKDRNAVGFTILPNGHICIFDTNPGGAGYANQLDTVPGMMERVIAKSREMLLEAKQRDSADYLLDKFTIRYLNKISIDKALDWIAETGIN